MKRHNATAKPVLVFPIVYRCSMIRVLVTDQRCFGVGQIGIDNHHIGGIEITGGRPNTVRTDTGDARIALNRHTTTSRQRLNALCDRIEPTNRRVDATLGIRRMELNGG
jgi:hypothetical protein